jgi:exonuclease-1
MGIIGVLAALKWVMVRAGAEWHNNLYCSEFRGKKAAVDVHALVHRALGGLDFEDGLRLVLQRDQRDLETATGIVVRKVVRWCTLMREKGDLTVLPVFDGATPPAKAQTKATRSDRAAEARQKVLVAGHGAEATQVTAAAQGCIDSKLIAAVFAALTRAGFEPRIALKEADAELARMGRSGEADIVITPDSDLIALGAQPHGSGRVGERSIDTLARGSQVPPTLSCCHRAVTAH